MPNDLPNFSRANFRTIFDAVETGIFVIDPETHQIVDANPVALAAIGAPLRQTIGSKCHQFVCPAEEGRCPVTDLGQVVDNSERTLLTTKGESRAIIKTVRPVQMNGRPYLLESFIDITERKRSERALEERTSYLNALIEVSPLGTVVLDTEECVQMSNPALEQLFRYSRAEMQGKELPALIVPPTLMCESRQFTNECMSGRSIRCSTRRRRKDNTLVDVDVYGVPLVIGGKIQGILALYQDITAPRRMEAELRESENRFRTAFEEAPFGMCMTGLDGRFLHANAALCKMLGYPAEELLAGAWQSITYPDDLERSRQIAVQFSKGVDSTLELEKRYLHKDGHVVWGRLKISIVRNSHGEASHYITQIEDITQRKQADEARAFLVSLVESSQDAIIGTNPEGIVMSWNHGAEELYGYRAQEMVGKLMSALISAHEQSQLPQIVDSIRRGQRVSCFETFRVRKDGSVVDISLSVSPVFDSSGKITGTVSIARDISHRKLAEKALQNSEEKFRQLAETISEVFWMVQPGSEERLYVSPAYEQVWGRTRESLYRDPKSWTAAVHADDRQNAQAEFARQLRGEKVDSVYRIRTPDGQEKWIRDRAFPVRDASGRIARIVGLAEDISERKRSEERVRASEERYRELFENASDLVYTFDLKLNITSLNRLAEMMTGYSREEALQMNLLDLVDPAHRSAIERAFAGLIAGDMTGKIEMEMSQKDGHKVKLEMNPRVIVRDGKPVGFQGIARDVTGRDAVEVELRQAQKLESVGRLASGIAHEINTPMQFVGDNVRFLQEAFADLSAVVRKFDKPEAVQVQDSEKLDLRIHRTGPESDISYLLGEIPKALSQTLDGVERVVTIVRAMKEFAHPENKGMAPADINRALINTLTVARNELKYVANVETEFGELPTVVCTVSDLNQVFLNLLVNAAHAIGDIVKGTGKKGTIRVTTGVQDSAVVISISDTGTGIPDNIRHRIFDPFFTTKEVGRGTGQGLAIARAVIERHKGTLTFDSEIGKGTRFYIQLPIGESE